MTHPGRPQVRIVAPTDAGEALDDTFLAADVATGRQLRQDAAAADFVTLILNMPSVIVASVQLAQMILGTVQSGSVRRIRVSLPGGSELDAEGNSAEELAKILEALRDS